MNARDAQTSPTTTRTPDSVPDPEPIATPAHEHAWELESRHTTSEGWIMYVRCVGCAARRVDVQLHAEQPPRPLSREL